MRLDPFKLYRLEYLVEFGMWEEKEEEEEEEGDGGYELEEDL